MTEVLKTILPVAIMLAVGILCRRRSIISREGVQALKNVVVNITLPAVMLSAFADDAEQRTYVSSVLSVSTLAAIIGFAVLAALH